MVMLRLMVTLSVMVVGLVPAVSFADPVTDAVASLPAEIVHIRVGGEWRGEDEAGYLRLIVARIRPGDPAARLFVQWIGDDDKVVTSLEIEELADEPRRIVGLNLEPVDEGTDVFIDIVDLTTGYESSLLLLINEPTVYTIEPFGN